MTTLFDKNVKVPDDIMFQELSNGEIVFLNLDNETYYGLDGSGTIFWKEITGTKNIETAYNNLLEIFDVTPSDLMKDLNNLLEELKNNGIIEII